jgi:hypothetical protein
MTHVLADIDKQQPKPALYPSLANPTPTSYLLHPSPKPHSDITRKKK